MRDDFSGAVVSVLIVLFVVSLVALLRSSQKS
jgi:hypothetical protein